MPFQAIKFFVFVLLFLCTLQGQADFTPQTPGIYWAQPQWAIDFDDCVTVTVTSSQVCQGRILILKMDSSCWISPSQNIPVGIHKIVLHQRNFVMDKRRFLLARYHGNVNRKPYTTLSFENIAGLKLQVSGDVQCQITEVQFSKSKQTQLSESLFECQRLQTRLSNLVAFDSNAAALCDAIKTVSIDLDNIADAQTVLTQTQKAIEGFTQPQMMGDLSLLSGQAFSQTYHWQKKIIDTYTQNNTQELNKVCTTISKQVKYLQNTLNLKNQNPICRGVDDKSFFFWLASRSKWFVNQQSCADLYLSFLSMARQKWRNVFSELELFKRYFR